MPRRLPVGALLAALVASSCGGGAPEPPAAPTSPSSPAPTAATPTAPPTAGLASLRLSLEPFVSGVEAPLFLTHAGDGSGRTYVVGQTGRIHVADSDGTLDPTPFLDISDRIVAGGEQGLLGLAFHPEDPDRLFVNYTDVNGDTVVAEYRRSARGGDPRSERVLLRIDQPYANHNGGMLAFGPDGFLYIGTGDGGSGGDPHGNGQSLGTLLGKLLRIDVDGGRPYGIPSTNPFRDVPGARPEIWAYGLRNPWRFSFDRETGDLFIGDVGQNSFEEIDVEPAGGSGGANYGWDAMEGAHCFESESCDRGGLVLPVAEYPTAKGCAVAGGYVYRGTRFPPLRGAYLFADYCGGQIWALRAEKAVSGRAGHRLLLETGRTISSFGEDEAGELYATDLASGAVFRIAARAA